MKDCVFINACLQGTHTKLTLNKTWSCESICRFRYNWFPFDVQNCYENLELEDVNLRARFISAEYIGDLDLGKYYFRSLQFCTINKYGRNGAYTDLSFKRPLTGHFMTIFFPTGMLLMISQMSTTFNETFLEMVIEVNTTLLLVLTTQ